MRMTPGKVVSGNIVLEGESLPDGAKVMVFSREVDERFNLTEEMQAELVESVAEADRGELVPAEEVLRKVRSFV